jgi:CheY-like chemotaxis protein
MASPLQDRIYRRTASGEKALAAVGVALPSNHRLILWVIEGDTHSDVILGRLRQYPDALLANWLGQLENIGFVSSTPADAKHDLDFRNLLQATQKREGEAPPDDVLGMKPQAHAAAKALYRTGAFLSPERLKNRPSLAKKPDEITVLIVEDDPDQAALAELRLSVAGYEVRLARDCKELIEEIRARRPPDVVVLDVMLPDGNGLDVLASIRRHPALALLPVVMLTSLAKPEDVRRGLTLGADGYVTKPYGKQILPDTIRTVLKHL